MSRYLQIITYYALRTPTLCFCNPNKHLSRYCPTNFLKYKENNKNKIQKNATSK